MLAVRRSVTLLAALFAAMGTATTSHAENQQYEGSLVVESFGNDNLTANQTPMGAGLFSVFGMPQGVQCNPGQPRCPFASTPVGGGKGMGGYKVFEPLGNFCIPIGYFGATMRPAKGATATTGKAKNVHYRNPNFFTTGTMGSPNMTSCTAYYTVGSMFATMFLTSNDTKRGIVMKGAPLTGEQIVTLTGSTNPAGFQLKKAPTAPVKTPGPTGFGLRRTTSGEFNNIPPYLYSYTYATLRNDAGAFFAGGGFFGSSGAVTKIDLKYKGGGTMTVGRVRVKATPGGNKFGGVMRLLGKLTTRVCYYTNNTACLLGGNDWRYDSVGRSAYTSNGLVTKGYQAKYNGMYVNTMNYLAVSVMVKGYRFPWTTGYVTVSGLDKPHVTVEKRKGYDNRTDLGKGTIQLVTPVLTRWTQTGSTDQYTGGIGILRLRFVPEPGKWMMLVAGLSLLGILYRGRRR